MPTLTTLTTSTLRQNPSPRSRATETGTAGNKPDPTDPLIAKLAPSRDCIGANAATSPRHKQKASRVSPRGFCFLALADLSAASRPACAKHAGHYFSL